MKTTRLNATLLVLLAAGLFLAPAIARAQAGGSGAGMKPVPELSATYGSMWGGHIDTSSGTLRAGTGGSWGVALDIPIMYVKTVELSYTRQSGSIDLDRGGITTLSDMSVNYWHIGGLQAFPRGPVVPFVIGGLGATYYSPSKKSATIGGTTYSLESTTKFSLEFGLGFKSYFGAAKRVGVRASFKVLPTFFNTSGGMWVGTGGGGVSFSGSSIWQYEAAGGLTLRLGR
ncbi:MAG TPA: hypothetical protein VMJ30_01370 [Gemmatimonadales bacterium]|nr:hypothetical protein [Gemmatimonadales bacterium]